MKALIVGLLITLSNTVYADSFSYEPVGDLHQHIYPFFDALHGEDGKKTLEGVLGYGCSYYFSAYASNDPEKKPVAIIGECRIGDNDYRQLLCANLNSQKTDRSTANLGINQHATVEELEAFFLASKCTN